MRQRPDWLPIRNLGDSEDPDDGRPQLSFGDGAGSEHPVAERPIPADDASSLQGDGEPGDYAAADESIGTGYDGAFGITEIRGDGVPAETAVPGVEIEKEALPDLSEAIANAAAADGPSSFHDLHDRVVIMLLFEQIATTSQVQRVWQEWKEHHHDGRPEPLWRSFTRQPGVDRDRVFSIAASVYAFPKHPLDIDEAVEFIRENKKLFTEAEWEQMRSFSVMPVARGLNSTSGAEQIVFVTYDPSSLAIRQLLRRMELGSHDVRFVPEKTMHILLRRGFSKRSEYLERFSAGKVVHNEDPHFSDSDGVDNEVLEAEINRSAIIALFEAMLVEAVREGASDIHVVPGDRERVEVHFRIDGELHCWHVEDQLPASAFMAVVKDQAQGVDRFERDAAQDGSMQRPIDGALIRFRLSILPVANASGHGRTESVVIRVLDDRKVTTEMSELGLSELSLERFERALRQPYGMVVLTGPTGSGKSTTLRAALHHVVSPKRNVITVEDPVEYMVTGVRQIRVSHKLPVEDALRYILRHDPDVVMVGEMRDRTTAELAVKLSATGHLTFSTLHTNDAASAIGRLYKMGIEPYLLAYSINLIAAQRLVRILCPACKQPHDDVTPELLGYAGLSDDDVEKTTVFREGEDLQCTACGGARYKGRRAVAEVLELSEKIRSMIVRAGNQIDEGALRDQARKEGMFTLREAAQRLVKNGDTSIAELIRVTGA